MEDAALFICLFYIFLYICFFDWRGMELVYYVTKKQKGGWKKRQNEAKPLFTNLLVVCKITQNYTPNQNPPPRTPRESTKMTVRYGFFRN